jgi:hypothetical protein
MRKAHSQDWPDCGYLGQEGGKLDQPKVLVKESAASLCARTT